MNLVIFFIILNRRLTAIQRSLIKSERLLQKNKKKKINKKKRINIEDQ